ncbi:MAG: helix-turn-helix domain-containing protein [Streptosporangiaceae bacterium]
MAVDEGARVDESVAGRPAGPLRAYVAGYSGYRQTGLEPARHTGLPSPYLTLIFTLDEPITIVAHPDPAQPGGDYVTLAGGLHTAPAIVTHEGSQSGIQVSLSPLGSMALFGCPAGDLAGIDVDAAQVSGLLAAEIQQRIQAGPTWDARFAVLDEALARSMAASRDGGRAPVSPEVGFAWQRLLQSRGTVTVSALAAETGWSDRHLRNRFAREVGLTPKAAGRVVRFDRARRLLRQRDETSRPLDLAALAVHCGYYDQAHLDAEFRSLAGAAPTAWLTAEFRNLQAGDRARGEG